MHDASCYKFSVGLRNINLVVWDYWWGRLLKIRNKLLIVESFQYHINPLSVAQVDFWKRTRHLHFSKQNEKTEGDHKCYRDRVREQVKKNDENKIREQKKKT